MPERDRDGNAAVGLAAAVCVVVAIIVFGTMLGYRREHTHERDQLPAAEAAQDGRKINIDCTGVGTSSQQCTAILPPSEAADNAAKSDLRAQQEMAEWAFGMLIVTCAGFAVSAFGLWALFANLTLIRQQIDRTDKATDAIRRQEGAYPSPIIEGFQLMQTAKGQPFGLAAVVPMKLENLGRGTCDIQRIKIWIRNPDGPDAHRRFDIAATGETIRLKPAREPVWVNDFKKTAEAPGFAKVDYSNLQNASLTLAVEIYYRDVFSGNWKLGVEWNIVAWNRLRMKVPELPEHVSKENPKPKK